MSKANYQVIRQYTDDQGRKMVDLHRLQGAAIVILPAYVILHEPTDDLWRRGAPGSHVYVHPEAVKFHAGELPPLPPARGAEESEGYASGGLAV